MITAMDFGIQAGAGPLLGAAGVNAGKHQHPKQPHGAQRDAEIEQRIGNRIDAAEECKACQS